MEEKEVFRQQAAEHVQLIRQIMTTLAGSPNRRLRYEAVHSDLEAYFSQDEAEKQLDTAIDWGRYAELFAYDDQEGVFYQENPETGGAC